MNKVNLLNISQKLNISENTIKKFNFAPIEDSFKLSSKDQEYIDNLTKRVFKQFDFDELVNKLAQSKFCGGAHNFVDFTHDESNKILKVNIGLYNHETGKIDETSVIPNLFIDIFTNITAKQIEKNPEKEKYYKDMYLKLLNHIEKNKIKNV